MTHSSFSLLEDIPQQILRFASGYMRAQIDHCLDVASRITTNFSDPAFESAAAV